MRVVTSILYSERALSSELKENSTFLLSVVRQTVQESISECLRFSEGDLPKEILSHGSLSWLNRPSRSHGSTDPVAHMAQQTQSLTWHNKPSRSHDSKDPVALMAQQTQSLSWHNKPSRSHDSKDPVAHMAQQTQSLS